ncbi:DUF6221 family protein [Streptomyces thermolineatus]|uniref:DUF6221 family protein n=1 Tax=Streptomyces thermolineatus TaxID=44033 RepID=A0ABN3LML7_9ACTN
MTDDLIAFLRARLDEDEAVAREATAGPWRSAPTARHHATATGRTEEAVFAALPDKGAVVVASTGEAREQQNLVNAEHIARHADPARVLREVEAKRRLLALHEPGEMEFVDGDVCMACDVRDEGPHYPCLTLRLIAAVYDQHPDYREDWRP